VILDGKRILVTGIVNRHSIAYAIAEQAQNAGAEVLLTSFGRVRRLTERAAKGLPQTADVLELDVNKEEDFSSLTKEIETRWGGIDGAVHAVAYAPDDAIGGAFMETSRESAAVCFQTSAFSLKALAESLVPLFGHGASSGNGSGGGSLVALDFDASVAWPIYDWMGVSKAALESVARYLARDLGARGVRVNLISAGPLETVAASGIPGFRGLADRWGEQAPLGWDVADPVPVAEVALFLLSDLSRRMTGEILHVDGGYHAMGAPLAEATE
jgi:meromycolic acid enoyl-[acyl-carrier-protein] reductase